jgi:hypothetical protein
MKTYSKQISNNNTNIAGLKKLVLPYKIANFMFLNVEIPVSMSVNDFVKMLKNA